MKIEIDQRSGFCFGVEKVIKIAEDIMIRIARMFGMDGLPQPYWNEAEELDYPHGIPGR